jgi:hypothetical protein
VTYQVAGGVALSVEGGPFPEFPVKLDELATFLQLSSQKAAHAAVGWIRVQEIRVKPFFGLSGVRFTLKMYPTQAKLEWATLKSAAGYAG